jgi:hypothetical protein
MVTLVFPAAWAEVVQVIEVGVNETTLHADPPTSTRAPGKNEDPVRVRVVPPVLLPAAGVTELRVGATW